MARSASTTLKLYTERTPKPARPPIESLGSLPAVLQAFQSITGWSLRYKGEDKGSFPSHSGSKKSGIKGYALPIVAGAGLTAGHLSLERVELTSPRQSSHPSNSRRHGAWHSAVADMVNELMQTRHAALAAGSRFGGGGSFAAASTRTKIIWPPGCIRRSKRRRKPWKARRPLCICSTKDYRTEIAVLLGTSIRPAYAPAGVCRVRWPISEALLGHAVVLENTGSMPGWNAPEDFAAAVCVPVSSSTTILGTLWVFCDETRDFTDHETSMVEIVAGKIASDLRTCSGSARSTVSRSRFVMSPTSKKLRCNSTPTCPAEPTMRMRRRWLKQKPPHPAAMRLRGPCQRQWLAPLRWARKWPDPGHSTQWFARPRDE